MLPGKAATQTDRQAVRQWKRAEGLAYFPFQCRCVWALLLDGLQWVNNTASAGSNSRYCLAACRLGAALCCSG